MIETHRSGKLTVTQGFQQGSLRMNKQATARIFEEAFTEDPSLDIQAYPNPTYDYVTLKLNVSEVVDYTYGIYDMAGNAWEWVFDWYGLDSYKKGPEKNPIGPAKGDEKVVRGGSWLYVADFLRSAHRFNAQPMNRQFGYGFRCA